MRRIITALTTLALIAPLAGCQGQDEAEVERFEERAPEPVVMPPAATPAEPAVTEVAKPGTLTWLSSRDAMQEQMNKRSERFAERRREIEQRIADDAAEDVRKADNALNAAIYDFESELSELSGIAEEGFERAGERLRAAAQEVELRLMELSQRINDDLATEEEEPAPSAVSPDDQGDMAPDEGAPSAPTEPEGEPALPEPPMP